MNDVKCPECDSRELQIDYAEGSIAEGWFIENMECMECHATFIVKANFVDMKIEGDY